jgi:hypothetical protein
VHASDTGRDYWEKYKHIILVTLVLKRTNFIVACLVGIVFSLSFSIPVMAQYPDFFAGREPAAKPLDKLAQEYWQWWIGMPRDIPVDAETNLDKCLLGYDERGRVAFLVNPYEISYSSSCTISSDNYLIVPLLVGECDPTVPEVATKSGKIEDLWACAASADEPFNNWEVILDDVVLFKQSGNDRVNADLKNEILVRNSSQFTLNIPQENRYEVPGGSYPAVVDGYYLPLKPLPPGEHRLEYNILHELIVPGQLKKPISGSVTYNLNVTG